MLGLVIGFFIVMPIYNFLIYWILRLKAFLYYSAYVIIFFLFQYTFHGLAYQDLGPMWFTQRGILLFPNLCIIFVILFMLEFSRESPNRVFHQLLGLAPQCRKPYVHGIDILGLPGRNRNNNCGQLRLATLVNLCNVGDASIPDAYYQDFCHRLDMHSYW
jgi:hypothetical protein